MHPPFRVNRSWGDHNISGNSRDWSWGRFRGQSQLQPIVLAVHPGLQGSKRCQVEQIFLSSVLKSGRGNLRSGEMGDDWNETQVREWSRLTRMQRTVGTDTHTHHWKFWAEVILVLVAQLDDLCIDHWLFVVIISLSLLSTQRRGTAMY